MSTNETSTELSAIREALKAPTADLLSNQSLELGEVLRAVRSARWVLPAYQRPQTWSKEQICALVESLLKGLPMGSLLLSKSELKTDADLRVLEGVTLPKNPDLDVWQILDGQQRLTALHRVFCEDVSPRAPCADKVFCLQIGGLGRLLVPPKSAKATNRHAQELRVQAVSADKFKSLEEKPFGLLRAGYVPLYLLDPASVAKTAQKRSMWLKERLLGGESEASEGLVRLWEVLEEDLKKITQRLRTHMVPLIQVNSDYKETHAQTIIQLYIVLNTGGKNLNAVDIFVASTAALVGWDLYSEFEKVRTENEIWMGRYDQTTWNDFLRPFAIVSGRPSSMSGVAKCAPGELKEGWGLLVRSWQETVQFLDRTIFKSSAHPMSDAPSIAPLYVVCALMFVWLSEAERSKRVFELTEPKRALLLSYLWSSFAHNRYLKSADGKATQDFEHIQTAAENGATSVASLFEGGVGSRSVTVNDIEAAMGRLKAGGSPEEKTVALLRKCLMAEGAVLATTTDAAKLAKELKRRCGGIEVDGQ